MSTENAAALRCYIKPCLGAKVVSCVTAQDVQKLYTKLRRGAGLRPPGVGPRAVRHHGPPHPRHAPPLPAGRGDRPCHPPQPRRRGRAARAASSPKRILTREQTQTFLAAVEGSEVWRDFFYTELTTGLRRGEICGLMWQDFDECAGTLKIVRSVNTPKAGVLEIGETKTDRGRRTIRLPPSTAARLRERKKHAVSRWIFPESLAPEKPVRPSAAYYWMKRILREAGLPQIRLHDLRHSKAMHLLQSGVNLVYIRDLLGHVDVSTTEVYARADERFKREALMLAYPSPSPEPDETAWQKMLMTGSRVSVSDSLILWKVLLRLCARISML